MSNFKVGKLYDPALKDMPKDEIIGNLEAVSYQEEERSYTKNLTEEELQDRKEAYAQIGIKLSELEEEKKEFNERFKLLTKEPKSRAKELLQAVKFRSEQRYGKLYGIDDQESNTMYLFDENGMCVESRPLTKKEKQIRLKTVNE